MLHGWCHVKCCRFCAGSAYTIQPCTRSQCHFIQSHIGRVYVCLAVACHLHFWQNDRDLLRATAVTRGGTDTEIRVSTESWPSGRKFSRRSCRDSNPGPFDHESDALITELSPLPIHFRNSGPVLGDRYCDEICWWKLKPSMRCS